MDPRSLTQHWPCGIHSVHVILSNSHEEDCPWSFSFFQYGRTPLHLAANNGILDVVRYLCLTGANVEVLTSVSSLLVGESDHRHLRAPGHERKGIAWQLHSKADRLLLVQHLHCGYINICPHRPRVISS